MDVMAATEFLARSTPLSSMFWIGYIIVGALIGFVASKIGDGAGSGVLTNIVIGIAGASDQRPGGQLRVRHPVDRLAVRRALHRGAGIGDPALARRTGAANLARTIRCVEDTRTGYI